eukprot:Tbor_TRINITY_DN4615_c0_g2::TRINITY_DN4615_c0_g2_i1::g.14913::m.14913/K20182/VPS33; vacuolar protein sorting-associated protein 33
MSSSLRNEVINLSSYREAARATLSSTLKKIGASDAERLKNVIIDDSLAAPLLHGGIEKDVKKDIVDICQWSTFDKATLDTAKNQRVIFIIRPSLENLALVRDKIKLFNKKNATIFFHIYFVPKTVLAEHIIREDYKLILKDKLYVDEMDVLDLFPLEDDVLSMELNTDFKDLFLEKDLSLLHLVAKSVVNMQIARVGPIKRIQGKGKFASKVVRIIERLQNELGEEFLSEKPAEVEAMLIIDRSVDLYTPMKTQLTYEGLIDELYSIDCGHFTPDFNVTTSDTKPETKHEAVALNNDDTIFSEIRNRNFSSVGAVLRQKSIEIRDAYQRRKEVQHLKEITEFMKALPETQERQRQIGIHTNIATQIGKTTKAPDFREQIRMEQSMINQDEYRATVEFIEEMINMRQDVRKVLRLLSLFSLINGGVKPRTYDQMKESLMLAYGIPQMIAALYNLEKAGLIVRQDTKSNFSSLRKSFRLWVDNLDEKQPNDAGYVYSGYCPLLTRVVECMVGTCTAPLDSIPGEQYVIENNAAVVAGSNRVIIIYIVGGVTYSELSTMRFVAGQLSSQTGVIKHFVFVTTSITNGDRVIASMLPFKIHPEY